MASRQSGLSTRRLLVNSLKKLRNRKYDQREEKLFLLVHLPFVLVASNKRRTNLAVHRETCQLCVKPRLEPNCPLPTRAVLSIVCRPLGTAAARSPKHNQLCMCVCVCVASGRLDLNLLSFASLSPSRLGALISTRHDCRLS